MVDCLIIGSGVAGISAALTLQANGKSFLLFGSSMLSEKIVKAERIRNYPGLSNVTGEAFYSVLKRQMEEAGIAVTQEKVTGMYALKDKFGVATQQGNYYEGRTAILACGVESIKQVEGELEFSGRGVSYCATCDGFLYKGKTIAVLCTSKRLEHEVEYLADFAQKVYLIAMYKDVEIKRENVQVIRKMPLKLEGKSRVEKVVFSANLTEDVGKELSVDGIFMLRESISPSILVAGLEMQDAHVVVSREMQTNFKGCYAAGDCTGRPYQYAKAVGEGNVAAHSASLYINEQKKKE